MKDLTGKPRVLIIAFAHFDNVFSYAKHLGDSGLDITLLILTGVSRLVTGTIDKDLKGIQAGYFKDPEMAEKFLPREHIDFLKNSIKLEFVKTPAPPSLKKNFFRNYRFLKRTAKTIGASNFDVIHFNGTGIFCHLMAMFLKKLPKVWTLHDYKPHSGEGRLLTNYLNKKTVKKFDAYIQHYDYLKNAFSEYYNISKYKVFQAYSGTFDIFKMYDVPERLVDEPYMLFFGRLSPYKALEELVEAYNELTDSQDQESLLPKLVIAGSGELWFSMEKIRLNSNIVFLHKRISTKDLISLIAHSQFVVAPYKNATHSAVVMVSYTFLKPVLVTDVGGLSEVVYHGKTGIVAKNFTPQSLKTAILEMLVLMKNPQTRNLIEEAIRHGELSWQNISNKYASIYKQAICFKVKN